MNKIFLLLVVLSPIFFVFCKAEITFKVEELSKPTVALSEMPVSSIYEELIRKDVGVEYQRANDKTDYHYNIVAQSKTGGHLVNYGYHSFFQGMYKTYADHRPFVLSPDMIWLLISQGFARHVNANAEKLRGRFVDYSGKLTLVVNTQTVTLDNPDSPWEEIFPEFTKQMSKQTGAELMNALTSDFTTTTPIEKVASEITVMEAMKSYFEFVVMRIGCGIPEITLKGTPEDWQKILDKTKRLATYDLEWWTNELEPILKQFVEASKGNVDAKHWAMMFKYHAPKSAYTPDIIDGWIIKFFPYDKNGKRNDFKPLLGEINGAGNVPEEIVKVDVKYIDTLDGETTPLELWAGFIGLEQDEKNYTLTPKIGWMIRKKDVRNDAMRQKFIEAMKSGDEEDPGQISIRVKEVPEALLDLDEIQKLVIRFIGKINIPDEMTRIKIGTMILIGEVDEEGKARIIKLFPKTKIYFERDSEAPPAMPVESDSKK